MSSSLSTDPELQRNGEDVTASVEKLQQLIDDNVLAVPPPVTQDRQLEGRRQLLSAELLDLHEKKKQIERELRRSSRLQTSTVHLCAGHQLRASITQRLVQSEALLFQEEALSALRDLLTQDLQRSDGEETFSDRRSDHSMQGKNETEPGNNMRTPESSSSHSNAEEAWRASHKKPAAGPSRSSNLRRAGSVKDLISRFSDDVYPSGAAAFGGGRTPNSACAPEPPKSKSPASAPSGVGPDGRPVPRIAVTPPLAGTARSEAQRADRTSARSDGPAGGGSETDSSKTQTADSGSDSVTDSGVGSETELESNKQPDSPSEDEPTTPRAVPPSQNPKYQLFLNNDLIKTNGLSGRDGGGGSATENGPRFEMRSLLVNNEDLLRTNTQLTNEMKRMREQMVEMERESQTMSEKFREMEIEVREAREVMVEANTQEYAFNFLQQSLKNRIQDAEENLDKQTLHAQTLAEKLWLAERQLEDLEVDKETKDKKTSELNSTLLRLESELGDALLVSTQAATELNLQQKLREDAALRVDELEESLLEKDQELQRLRSLVGRLQGEVSGKLIDKERTLEEEIQLRERIQLQCKQAERAVDDLHMELQSTNQARDDLSKQLKQAQEKLIDLESDLEELQDSEQRWAAKHKRAIEQLRELRLEVDELQSSRVQEDVVSRAESRAKELESLLRTEERNKAVLTNAIGKLERRINELTDQMEEEHRLSNEQKDLMTQRMRSLKRQLNEVEEEASRKEALHRHTQRELAEERESSGRLQRQLLEQHQQTKRKETLTIRQTLDNLRLDLSVDDEDDEPPQQTETVTKV
ncbi:hypothetical protein F2P81_015811 [Scophthalmus maximus]|uniref:Uncharacterized protein n=1 Tax=Scophthalmus maximus TaxID=52904 RepID=A0A6A4S7S5_SCOMX|nr:hypothetical protein F2P81_015811 [Scophthalmus maximus]